MSGRDRTQFGIFCVGRDHGCCHQLQYRSVCGDDLSVYGVDLGHQYHETGDRAAVFGCNDPACFFPSEAAGDRVPHAVPVNLQYTSSDPVDADSGSLRGRTDAFAAAVLVYHADGPDKSFLACFNTPDHGERRLMG